MDVRTLTLADFLLARIAEDEAVTRRCQGTYPPPGKILGIIEHVARWDYVRVLAEADAKRRIIRWATLTDELTPDDWSSDDDHATAAYTNQSILRALALPYTAHPDYRDEWRP